MPIYGYARVSGQSQHLDGQIEELKTAGANKVYSEKFTGTTTKRPEFRKLIKRMQPGDTLMVTKLDRFARTASEGLQIIEQLTQENIKIHVLNIGLMDNSPNGRLLRTIMLAFAEFERDLIVTRLADGKDRARALGTLKEGRPKYTFTPRDKEIVFASRDETYRAVSARYHLSPMTVRRRLLEYVEKIKQPLPYTDTEQKVYSFIESNAEIDKSSRNKGTEVYAIKMVSKKFNIAIPLASHYVSLYRYGKKAGRIVSES